MKKSKTFQEGDPIENPFLFLDGIIWDGDYAEASTNRDPADITYHLSRKMKVTIEIFDDTNDME
jgi:hypothetical protein